MKIFVLLIVFISLNVPAYSGKRKLLPDSCGRSKKGNNQTELTELEEFPWLVTLIYRNAKSNEEIGGHVCGGVLINYIYVLTTAHCVIGNIQQHYGNVYKVRLGVWDLLNDTAGERVVENTVSETIVHNRFLDDDNGNPRSHRLYNIALLRLSNRLHFTNYVRPICLPTNNERDILNVNDSAILSGWGVNYPKSKKINMEKLKINMKIIDQNSCFHDYLNIYGVNVTSQQFCATKSNGESCFGIGGEPLMKYHNNKWYLAGLVSHGPSDDLCNKAPDIYEKVPAYFKWIQDNMRE